MGRRGLWNLATVWVVPLRTVEDAVRARCCSGKHRVTTTDAFTALYSILKSFAAIASIRRHHAHASEEGAGCASKQPQRSRAWRGKCWRKEHF